MSLEERLVKMVLLELASERAEERVDKYHECWVEKELGMADKSMWTM